MENGIARFGPRPSHVEFAQMIGHHGVERIARTHDGTVDSLGGDQDRATHVRIAARRLQRRSGRFDVFDRCEQIERRDPGSRVGQSAFAHGGDIGASPNRLVQSAAV